MYGMCSESTVRQYDAACSQTDMPNAPPLKEFCGMDTLGIRYGTLLPKTFLSFQVHHNPVHRHDQRQKLRTWRHGRPLADTQLSILNSGTTTIVRCYGPHSDKAEQYCTAGGACAP